ncbi:hypothetical protein B0H10DRAFT_2433519 [Mycena sp. CBHHK59/15]|nr:hypothetical protein B0H10DRAFT_2433519 [Mycena sp. CBHHK59/15]
MRAPREVLAFEARTTGASSRWRPVHVFALNPYSGRVGLCRCTFAWRGGGGHGGSATAPAGGTRDRVMAPGSRCDPLRSCPIYFSLQVSFHTLGKDYRALVRRFQLDHNGAKLQVHKGLEVCAYAVGAGAGKSASRRRSAIPARRPCDVPLASALAGRALPAPAAHVVHAAEWLACVASQLNPDQHNDGAWGRCRGGPGRAAEATGSVEMSVPLEFDEDGDRQWRWWYLHVHADSEDDEALSGNWEDSTSISTPATYQLAPARGR